jgi:4-hydroxy-2-oxoheptanedioate aldolase
MKLPTNHFKQKLTAGKQQIGLWCTLSSAYTTEIVAESGFDWLLLDTEHSPNDVLPVLSQLQALCGYDVSPIVRPSCNDAVLIKRYLDFGVQTFLIPYVESAAEARRAVQSMRYAPGGFRGVADVTRATRFGRVKDYPQTVEAELCLLVQIETQKALDDLETIGSVDGVDGVFIGPADLAASLGHAGNPGAPEVKNAIKDAIQRIKAIGKPAGILTGNHEFARECIEWGTIFTAVGVDISILARETEKLAQSFK